ncbi:hypothetical protein Zm00014a_015011 [Zea mays]|uniref:Formation of crista junctions protein 1 n=1 Tax=Zea mays TaxID=4577 RepID=A0A3L6FXL8_MAIZE|nr:hypothetical protein Zm00014a_015011 [Zea mays]
MGKAKTVKAMANFFSKRPFRKLSGNEPLGTGRWPCKSDRDRIARLLLQASASLIITAAARRTRDGPAVVSTDIAYHGYHAAPYMFSGTDLTYPVQSPTFLKSRSNSTKASPKSSTQNAAPGPQGQPSQSGSNVSKLALGTLVVGAAAIGAHQLGYIDLQFKDKTLPFSLKKEDVGKVVYEDLKIPSEQKVDQTQNMSGPNTEIVQENNNETHTSKDFRNGGVGAPELPINGDQLVPAEEKKSETLAHETNPVPDEPGSDTEMPSEDSPAVDIRTVAIDATESSEVPHEQQTDKIDGTVTPVQSTPTTVSTYDHPTDPDSPKDLTIAGAVEQKSLAETYLLQDEPGLSKDATIKEKRSDEVVREKNSEDGKIVLDIIEAIHAAEKKQADVDAYMYSEERRKLKEKYEKELKDTRARELMYAEEAAILDKELKKEKLKNAAAIKELQEKAEQTLQDELQRKAQEIAKAELAAAVAKEKASQIEQIAEANLNFNSLKETIRHLSLLPAGGGGILAHAVARVASSIKVKAKEIIFLTSLISDYTIGTSILMFLE